MMTEQGQDNSETEVETISEVETSGVIDFHHEENCKHFSS